MNVHRQTDKRTHLHRPRGFRPGTSVAEFLLALPVLAIVLGLTFFFGWAMMNKHQVLVADRYSTWRKVEAGTWPTEDALNQEIFGNRATNVSLSAQGVQAVIAQDLVDEAAAYGPRAEELAERLLLGRFPTGQRAVVAASFDANQGMWSSFTGPISHHHAREGVTWRRDEVNCWGVLRDLYYTDLDGELQRLAPPAHNMAKMIRGLYLARW